MLKDIKKTSSSSTAKQIKLNYTTTSVADTLSYVFSSSEIFDLSFESNTRSTIAAKYCSSLETTFLVQHVYFSASLLSYSSVVISEIES